MEEYVHLSIIIMSHKTIWVTLKVFKYTLTELNLQCTWIKHYDKRILFRNDDDIRCFYCIPWGNYKIASKFIKIGGFDNNI